MNPFISFCLYVAARVFVQLLKGKPKESQAIDTLRFLLTAMSALKRRNPLTESFLVQLDVDLEALGDRIPELKSAFPMSTDSVSSKMLYSPAFSTYQLLTDTCSRRLVVTVSLIAQVPSARTALSMAYCLTSESFQSQRSPRPLKKPRPMTTAPGAACLVQALSGQLGIVPATMAAMAPRRHPRPHTNNGLFPSHGSGPHETAMPAMHPCSRFTPATMARGPLAQSSLLAVKLWATLTMSRTCLTHLETARQAAQHPTPALLPKAGSAISHRRRTARCTQPAVRLIPAQHRHPALSLADSKGLAWAQISVATMPRQTASQPATRQTRPTQLMLPPFLWAAPAVSAASCPATLLRTIL